MKSQTQILEDAPVERLVESNSGNGRAEKARSKALPRIVAILPRGEAIRNFVYTGTLDGLARTADLSLLSVIPSDDLRELLCARYESVRQLRYIKERGIVRSIRQLLDMAHGRWLWSEAAQERWRLRNYEAKTPARKLKRFAQRLACYPFANRQGLELLSFLELKSGQWLRTSDEYVRYFEELKPSLVFNGSHVHSRVAIQAMQAARWLSIPTVAFIFSWDNLTSQGRIMPPYDYYLVWNDSIRDQLLRIYPSVRPNQVFVTGTPQFDFHFRQEYHWTRQEFCGRVGADPDRPIVLYSTGMANHMPGEVRIVERIAGMLRDMTELGPPQLVVRVYPKDQTNRFDELKEKRPDILFPEALWEPEWETPKSEDTYMLTNMLRHADVGINVASTVSLELCMFDKPVLNVGYNPPGLDVSPIDYARYYRFDHYRPIVESGAVEVAYSEEALHAKIKEALLFPDRRQVNRKSLIKQYFGHTLDGWSSTRVAEVLQMLALRNSRG